MTCVVGLVSPDGCVSIGADSAGTADTGMQTIRVDRKVFRLGPSDHDEQDIPHLILGGTTSFRMLQLLQYALEVPPYTNKTSIEKYLVTDFVDAVRACFKKGGYDKRAGGEEQGGEFLVGWQGKLYHLFEDYQVSEAATGYDAVGDGESIALGVLFATQNLEMPSEERLLLALRAAAYHCQSVRPPFLIENLKRVTI